MKNHKLFSLIFFLLLLQLITSCNTNKKQAQPEDKKHPNIILIISDDQSWTDYGFLGHEHIKTPRIDQLAEEGLTFTRGYTAAPLCRPATIG